MASKTPEQIREESLEQLKQLRPIDDIFMREMFRDNKPLAEFVLRTITGISDLEIIEEHTQYDLKRLMGARGLCLDVYARDSKDQRFDMEVQRDEGGADPYRARYHISSMNMEFLNKNAKFTDLPITYVIFITETDVFGEGKLIYHIERINKTTGKPFKDGEHIIYVNSSYFDENDNSDLAKLAHDFLCSDPDEMYLPIMADSARYYKTISKGVTSMCKSMEDRINESNKEAKHEQAVEMAVNCIKEGLGTLEKIAKVTGLSLDEVTSLAKDNNIAIA